MKVFIENDRGSRIKRNYDLDLNLVREDRVLLPYPYPYGFVLDTRTEDGEGVDCYMLTREPLPRGSVAEADPAGLLVLRKDGREDKKVIAVPPGLSLGDFPEAMERIREFILGISARRPKARFSIGDILPPEAARDYLAAHSAGKAGDRA